MKHNNDIIDKLTKEYSQYCTLEGQLFYGIYSQNIFKYSGKDSPKAELIIDARASYNNMRKKIGLDEITEWTQEPKRLSLENFLCLY